MEEIFRNEGLRHRKVWTAHAWKSSRSGWVGLCAT